MNHTHTHDRKKSQKKFKWFVSIGAIVLVAIPSVTLALKYTIFNKKKTDQLIVTQQHFNEYFHQALDTVYSCERAFYDTNIALQESSKIYNSVEDEKHKILDEIYDASDALTKQEITNSYWNRLYSTVKDMTMSVGYDVYDSFQTSKTQNSWILDEKSQGDINNDNIDVVSTALSQYRLDRQNLITTDAEIFTNPGSNVLLSLANLGLGAHQRERLDSAVNDVATRSVALWASKRTQQDDLFMPIASSNLNFARFALSGIEGGYTNGSIISKNELGDFFKYSYSKSVGQLQRITHSTNIDEMYGHNIDSGTTLNPYSTNTDLEWLSGYHQDNINYAPGEIFPGYTLVAKIANIDSDSDSHNLLCTFDLGVCPTQYFDTYSSHTVWFDELDQTDDEDSNSDNKRLHPIVDVPLTKNDIQYIANLHFNDNDCYVNVDTESEIYSAVGTGDTITLTDRHANSDSSVFDNAEDLLSLMPIDDDDKIGYSFNNVIWKKDNDDDQKTNTLDFMPRFSNALMQKISDNNSLYTNQFINLKVVNYAQTNVGSITQGIDLTFAYNLVDKFTNTDVLSLKDRLPIRIGSSVYHYIKVHFDLSDSFLFKFSLIKNIVNSYMILKEFNYEFFNTDASIGTSIVKCVDRYNFVWNMWVSKYVFDVLLPIISAALVAAYGVLAAASFGVLAFKLVMAAGALAISIYNAVPEGKDIKLMTNANDIAYGYLHDSDSPKTMIDNFVSYGVTKNFDSYYDNLFAHPVNLSQQISLINQFFSATNDAESIYDIIGTGLSLVFDWLNKPEYKKVDLLTESVKRIEYPISDANLCDISIWQVFYDQKTAFDNVCAIFDWTKYSTITAHERTYFLSLTCTFWYEPILSYFAFYISKAEPLVAKFSSVWSLDSIKQIVTGLIETAKDAAMKLFDGSYKDAEKWKDSVNVMVSAGDTDMEDTSDAQYYMRNARQQTPYLAKQNSEINRGRLNRMIKAGVLLQEIYIVLIAIQAFADLTMAVIINTYNLLN